MTLNQRDAGSTPVAATYLCKLSIGELMNEWIDKIHHGDCLDVMGKMPSESVNVIVTSPPYNLLNTSSNSLPYGDSWDNARLIEGYSEYKDNMPHDEYVKWQRNCLSEMMRILAPKGCIFYNHKWRTQKGLLQDRADIVDGFPVRQIIIWDRGSGTIFSRNFFVPSYEVIYLIVKPGFQVSKAKNSVRDVWRINHARNNPHPAPFPVELARLCIESTTGDIVLDPFIGSGTTGVAAKQLGRHYIGIDQSEEYCKMARERIAGTSKLTLL